MRLRIGLPKVRAGAEVGAPHCRQGGLEALLLVAKRAHRHHTLAKQRQPTQALRRLRQHLARYVDRVHDPKAIDLERQVHRTRRELIVVMSGLGVLSAIGMIDTQ